MTLTQQQAARARALHEESIILLAHDHFFPPDPSSHSGTAPFLIRAPHMMRSEPAAYTALPTLEGCWNTPPHTVQKLPVALSA